MNPNYPILSQLHALDTQAGQTTQRLQMAKKQVQQLSHKITANEDLVVKTRADMSYLENEMRSHYKRLDELEEKKGEKGNRLFAARDDDEHRLIKREMDNVERECKDVQRKAEETESRIEHLKEILNNAHAQLKEAREQSGAEIAKAQEGETLSQSQLGEMETVRQSFLAKLVDDNLRTHYTRVYQVTRSPQGPIAPIENGACGNCRMGLAPQLLNTVLKGENIHYCPSCHHILLPTL